MSFLFRHILFLFLSATFALPDVVASPIIDSLKHVRRIQLENGEQQALIETYFALGREYLGAGFSDSAYAVFEDCEAYAASLDKHYMQFRALLEMGRIDNYTLNNPRSAVRHLRKAEDVSGEELSVDDQRNLFFELGNAFLLANDFKNAMRYQLKSVNLAESSQDTAFIAEARLSLGALHWQIDQFSDALQSYRVAYELRHFLPGPDFTILSSMAIAHFSLGNLDSALVYIRQARTDAAQQQEVYGEAYSLGLIGNIKMNLGNYSQAIDSLEASVALCEEYGYMRDALSFRTDLGKAYGLDGQYARSLEVLRNAELTAKSTNQLSLLLDNFETQAQIHEWRGDSSSALVYLKQFYQLKDSMLNQEVLGDMAEIEQGYELDKRDNTILEQQAELEESRRLLYIYGFASGILFLLVILYMAYVRNKALREVNQVLEEKNTKIRRQNDRLASSNEDLRQFAHVTSHDLREPLRNISSFATLLSRRYQGKLDEDADEYLAFITSSAKRMDRLLNDLLTYSVVGVFNHEYTQVDVAKVISDIMRRIQQNKTMQGARISLQSLPEIRANAQQMDQLFAQLIDNAIKFRSPERKPEIIIRAESRENGYVFSVKDNGIGMDKAYKDKIFALFLRLHNQQSAYEGSGIGLSIVKKIVEQHEGRIWIESELGAGTTVFFFLPKNPPSDATPVHVKDRWQWLNKEENDTEERVSEESDSTITKTASQHSEQ